MTPGTYTGKDGREYRWRKFGPDVVLESITDVSSVVPAVALAAVDIPAAKSALDALVEQEAGEWVTWRSGEFDYRAKPDGSIVEWADKGRCDWTSWDCPDIADAYRKGRSVAQQEAADLRDAARELVEAVGDFDEYLPWEGQNAKAYRWMKTAAKVLEEKL